MIWINLLLGSFARHRLRYALTFAVLALAFALITCLDAVRAAFSSGAGDSGRRLVIVSAYSLDEGLPVSQVEDLRREVPEIATIAWARWVGGYDRQKTVSILNIAVSDNYFEVYPEYGISAAMLTAFLRRPDTAIVGKRLAAMRGWQVGQRVVLRGIPLVNRVTGDPNWEYEIVGLFEMADGSLRGLENQFFTRWDYLVASAAYTHAKAGWLIAATPDAATAQRIAPAIDAATRDSHSPTRTQTEDAFQRQLANRVVDVAAASRIVTIVILLLLWLMTAKSANSAIRERSRDLGILKSLGFPSAALFTLIVADIVVIVFAAAMLGMGLATALLAALGDGLDAEVVLQPVGDDAWRIFLGAALTLSLLGSVVPAFKAARAKCPHLLKGVC